MRFEQELTATLKRIILEAPLYDTGDLYRSISVSSEIFDGELQVDISSEEYLVYHLENKEIIELFTESSEFQEFYERTVQEQIDLLGGDWLFKDSDVGFSFTPRIIITINGS